MGNSAGGAIALSLAHARPRAVTQVVAVGSMGHPMTLPPGLDELWGYEPSREAARAVVELISPGPAGEAAVEARLQASLAQPHYAALFPAPRQRWVDDLSLSSDELAAITAPVLLIHGTRDRIVPAARRRARAAGRAARRPGAPLRRRRPRHPARTHRRIQPTRDDLPGDRPMTDFAVLRTPSQVLFGAGMAAAAGRVAAGHGRRVLVITDPVIAETPGFGTVLESLADLDVAVFRDAVVDVPRSAVDAAVAAGRSFAPDVIVAVGGGSVIDLAKVTALLLAHGGALEDYYAVQSVPGPVVPLIALPTTAGTGSEATPVSVITDPATEMKIGVASPHLIPRHATLRPAADRGRAAVVTAHAGIDALSHAIEAYMAAREEPSPELVLGRPQVGKNLLSDTLALTAAGHIVRNLERAVADGSDLEARTGMLYGSLLAGMAFANSGVAAAHALQFALGALTHTSHGLGTGVLLPYVMEFNRPARERRAGRALARDGRRRGHVHARARPARSAYRRRWRGSASPRPTCARWPRPRFRIKRLIDNNPRPLDVDALEAILTAAWHGEPSRLAPVVA